MHAPTKESLCDSVNKQGLSKQSSYDDVQWPVVAILAGSAPEAVHCRVIDQVVCGLLSSLQGPCAVRARGGAQAWRRVGPAVQHTRETSPVPATLQHS